MTTNPLNTIKTDHLTQAQAIERIERLSREHGISTTTVDNAWIATRLAAVNPLPPRRSSTSKTNISTPSTRTMNVLWKQ